MYFFVDTFLRRWRSCSWSAAPTSGYLWVTAFTAEWISDSEACVDGGDMSPVDCAPPGNPDTFGSSRAGSVVFDVDATAFARAFAYLAGCEGGKLMLPLGRAGRAG